MEFVWMMDVIVSGTITVTIVQFFVHQKRVHIAGSAMTKVSAIAVQISMVLIVQFIVTMPSLVHQTAFATRVVFVFVSFRFWGNLAGQDIVPVTPMLGNAINTAIVPLKVELVHVFQTTIPEVVLFFAMTKLVLRMELVTSILECVFVLRIGRVLIVSCQMMGFLSICFLQLVVSLHFCFVV